MAAARAHSGGSRRRAHQSEAVGYVYIAGASYCGSTLLTFLLNAHPDCVSVGESLGLGRHARYGDTPVVISEYRCSCGERLLECPFWLRLAERMGELGETLDLGSPVWPTRLETSRNRYLRALAVRSLGHVWLDTVRDLTLGKLMGLERRVARTALANARFARAAIDITGTSVFVDSSKMARRVRMLERCPDIALRVVQLVRDARGGTASHMKKRKKMSDAARATREWRRRNMEIQRVRCFLPAERWMTLRYSDLCADVQGTMDRVADFIGVERAPVPPDFRSVEHHIIGNYMRLGGSSEIREDLSWQQLLTESDLAAIARISGVANRLFGYNWPPEQ